jgi:hypothetical protein
MYTNNLANKIATYRYTMNKLSKGKSLIDPDVIKLRQGLDVLLHKYYFELYKPKHESPDTQVPTNI